MVRTSAPKARDAETTERTGPRLAVMHCCWMKLDFAAHCGQSAELGFELVESFEHLLSAEVMPADEARQVLEEHGLTLLLVIARHLGHGQAAVEGLKRSMEYFNNVGVSRFVALRAAKEVPLDDFRRMLARAVPVVEAAGLVPLAQNHVGGAVTRPEHLLACEETGARLHFDTQQFHMEGVDVLEAWERLAGKVVHVHLGDRLASGAGCAMGEGVVPTAALLRRMHASGYRGDFTLEVEPEGARDERAAPHVARSKAFVEAALEPLGTLEGGGEGHAAVAASSVPAVRADWGELHWVANGKIFSGCGQTLGFVTLRPGRKNPLHRHPDDDEVIYIRGGSCLHRCGERRVRLSAGDVLYIPAGQAHQAENDGDVDCKMLVLYPTGERSFEPLEA